MYKSDNPEERLKKEHKLYCMMAQRNKKKKLELDEQYKYLELLESDTFESNQIKTKSKDKYKK